MNIEIELDLPYMSNLPIHMDIWITALVIHKPIKVAFLISQFLRIRRNCTDWTEFLRHSIKLYIHFAKCGNPHKLVSSALIQVNKLSQTECISSNKEDTSKDALYCILEFNSTNPPVKEWIQEL